jgi:phospho-N-acetylmuramoyl-pentapeptide-transferase
MFFWLSDFSASIGALNVFRYLTFRTAGATATGLAFVFFFGPMIIGFLKIRQGKGQPIREDGPATHCSRRRARPPWVV